MLDVGVGQLIALEACTAPIFTLPVMPSSTRLYPSARQTALATLSLVAKSPTRAYAQLLVGPSWIWTWPLCERVRRTSTLCSLSAHHSFLSTQPSASVTYSTGGMGSPFRSTPSEKPHRIMLSVMRRLEPPCERTMPGSAAQGHRALKMLCIPPQHAGLSRSFWQAIALMKVETPHDPGAM